MEAAYEPKTLREAIVFFSDQMNCIDYLVAKRPEWNNGVVCPQCGSSKVASSRLRCSGSAARHPKR